MVLRGEAPRHADGQTFPRVLIHHRQHSQRPPVVRPLVEAGGIEPPSEGSAPAIARVAQGGQPCLGRDHPQGPRDGQSKSS